MEKVLSISIAAYNAENFIKKCLDSMVYTSVINDLDIIVVDDGSKDGTLEIAQKYRKRFPESIRIITKPNGGHGSTINASIPIAVGKYYKIVDSDDWVDSEGIEALVRYLRELDVDLVLNPYYNEYMGDSQKKQLVEISGTNLEPGRTGDVSYIRNVFMAMHSITFNRRIIERMGPCIDEHCFYVDLEYILFSIAHVETCVVLSEPVYHYLLGNTGQSVSKHNYVKRRGEHIKVFKRLVDFYKEEKKSWKEANHYIILRRIQIMLRSQYRIFSWMDYQTAKKEIREFDRWLVEQPEEIYENTSIKSLELMSMNRKMKYTFCKAFLYILNRYLD